MEIKTGNRIYLKGLDVIEANKLSKYDDRTTKERINFDKKKWVTVDELIPILKKATILDIWILIDKLENP